MSPSPLRFNRTQQTRHSLHRKACSLPTAAAVLICSVALGACGSSNEASPKAGSEDSSSSPSATQAATPTPSLTPSDAQPAGPTLKVTVDGDNVTPTGKELKLGVGQTLTIAVTANRAGELHVHSSPEQELAYNKGQTTLTVTIDKPGVVDVEDHIADALVAQLEVS